MASSKSSVITAPVLGGFQPVLDVKDNKHEQFLGMFAVAEYNKEHPEEADLVFLKVVEAQSQVVAGRNHSLLIKALDGGLHIRFYKALVYERPWENFRTLTSFKPVLP